MNSKLELIDHHFFFDCPHCDGPIMVNISEVNCRIFRHAIYKSTGTQVNPHLIKEGCDELINKNLVYGCCKPFRINLEKKEVEICDYL